MLIIFGLLIGAMSFSDLPIRKILFDYVPLMNLFLQGPYLRVFMILGLVIFIARGIEKWNLQQAISFKNLLLPITVISSIFLVIALRWASFDFTYFFRDWLNLKDGLTGWNKFNFQQLLGFQLILSTLFLSLLVFILLFSSKFKRPKLLISGLIFLELFLAAQWNQTETYVDSNFKPFYLQKNIALTPTGFPIPHLVPIAYNDEQHAFIQPLWRNTYIFQKEISFNAFSSFELNNYSYLDDEEAKLKDWVLRSSLVYFSSKVLPLSILNSEFTTYDLNENTVFTEEKEFTKLQKLSLSSDKLDKLKITGFSPNAITIKTKTKKQQLLILQQSFQKDWKSRIDGKTTEIIRVNKNYQALILPAGKHTIIFKFEKNNIIILYFLSQFLFWFLLVYLIYLRLNINLQSKWFSKILFAVPIIFISFWAIKLQKGTLNKLTTNQQLLADWSQKAIVKKVVLPPLVSLTKNEEFYNIGKWKLKDLENASTLRLQTSCKMDTIQPTLFTYQIIRNGEQIKWEAFKIERQLEQKGKFNSVIFMRNLSDLQADDELILDCWNLSKSTIHFNNTTIEFLE